MTDDTKNIWNKHAFLTSEDNKEYFYVSEFADNDIYWCRGKIGERERIFHQPLYDVYGGDTCEKMIAGIFPDGDFEALPLFTHELSFRDMGYYLAQSVGFTQKLTLREDPRQRT